MKAAETLQHCQNCGAKTIWVEITKGSVYSFESGCPKCLLHVRISNGHVEVTRPDTENEVAPEPRKPREWWINAAPDYHPFDCAYKARAAAVGLNIVHVREVIE